MTFHLQDPTIPFSYSLHEALLQASTGALSGGGAYAFVSQDGIKLLLEDAAFVNFVENGSFKLVVGIDQITNERALNRLRELRDKYKGLEVVAFYHSLKGSLFHPKFTWFKNKQGGVLVVGSGNLTASGLRSNWEAFGVMQVDKSDLKKIEDDWNRWMSHSSSRLLSIDHADVIEKAKSNVWGRKYAAKKVDEAGHEIQPSTQFQELLPEDIEAWRFNDSDQCLIVEIPQSGNRWKQANFDKESFVNFFGAIPGENSLRVLLRNIREDASFSDIEVRPSISVKSQNYRFELEAAAGIDYPTGNKRPLGLFVRVSTRMFLYILAMPSDRYYAEVMGFVKEKWKGREDRMKRVIVTVEELKEKVKKFAVLEY
jgi:HKD family nuclease